jgi:hypothetical protein
MRTSIATVDRGGRSRASRASRGIPAHAHFYNVCPSRFLLRRPRRRLQGDQDPSAYFFERARDARTRGAARRRRATRANAGRARMRIVSRGRARGRAWTRAGARTGARGGRNERVGMFRVVRGRGGRGGRGARAWGGGYARAVDARIRYGFRGDLWRSFRGRPTDRLDDRETDDYDFSLDRRPSLSPRPSRLTSTRNSVPTRAVANPRSSRSAMKRTPSAK